MATDGLADPPSSLVRVGGLSEGGDPGIVVHAPHSDSGCSLLLAWVISQLHFHYGVSMDLYYCQS